MVNNDNEIAKESAVESAVEEELSRAILFELENLTADGRQVTFDVAKKLFDGKGVKLQPFTFSHLGVDSSIQSFVENVLEKEGKSRVSPEKFTEELADKIKSTVSKKDLKLDAGMKKMFSASADKKVLVGALSALDDKTATAIVEKLQLKDSVTDLLTFAGDSKKCASADAWLKLAKKLGVPPALCVVVTTSSASCKAALSAGMRAIAIPDSFTSFEDFGGASYVEEEMTPQLVDNLLTLLESC